VIPSLGIDIVQIDRIRQALRRRPRLAARLFTDRERTYCERRADPAPHYAARFAAKEAAAKAIGRWLRWQEVEVVNDSAGRPNLEFHGDAARLAGTAKGGQALVSLSHERHYAVACVLLVMPQGAAGLDDILPRGGARV
jgi:holo-[acyl-carrier protein] synthase